MHQIAPFIKKNYWGIMPPNPPSKHVVSRHANILPLFNKKIVNSPPPEIPYTPNIKAFYN